MVNQFNESGNPFDGFEEFYFRHDNEECLAVAEETDPWKNEVGEILIFCRYDMHADRFRFRFLDTGQQHTLQAMISLVTAINVEYQDRGLPHQMEVIQLTHIEDGEIVAYNHSRERSTRFNVATGVMRVTDVC